MQPIATNLDQFGQIWTNLDYFLQVCINFYKFRPIMKKEKQVLIKENEKWSQKWCLAISDSRALLTPQGGSELKIR